MSMVSWPEFTQLAPDLAGRGRSLLLLSQPRPDPVAGLAYLATIRKDGGPRIHPISPAFVSGRLYAFVLQVSPKKHDLLRDPRYALHSWPHPMEPDSFNDEEFYLTGHATLIHDEALRQVVANACGDAVETGMVFELSVDRAMHKHRPYGQAMYTKWPAT